MHSITTPALVAAADTSKLLSAAGVSATTLLIIFAIGLVASIFANWVASKLLAKPKATVGRAAVTMAADIAWLLLFALILTVVIVFLGAAKADGGLVGIALIGGIVVFIIVTIYIPMRIYDIGILRSIGFILLSGVISGIISNVATTMFAGPADYGKMAEQFVEMAKAKQQSIGAPDPEIAQRQAALQQRYEQLEIRRKYLPPNDHKAFREYERDRAAYEADLEQLRADAK